MQLGFRFAMTRLVRFVAVGASFLVSAIVIASCGAKDDAITENPSSIAEVSPQNTAETSNREVLQGAERVSGGVVERAVSGASTDLMSSDHDLDKNPAPFVPPLPESETFTVTDPNDRYSFSATAEEKTGLTLAVLKVEDEKEVVITKARIYGFATGTVAIEDVSLTPGDYRLVLSKDTPVEATTRIGKSPAPNETLSDLATKQAPTLITSDTLGLRQPGQYFLRPEALSDTSLSTVLLTFEGGMSSLFLYDASGAMISDRRGASPLRMTGIAGNGLYIGVVSGASGSDETKWRLTIDDTQTDILTPEGADNQLLDSAKLTAGTPERNGWLDMRDSDSFILPSAPASDGLFYLDYNGPRATLSVAVEGRSITVVDHKAALGPFLDRQATTLSINAVDTGPYTLTRRPEAADPDRAVEPDGGKALRVFSPDQRIDGEFSFDGDQDVIRFDLGTQAQMWRVMIVGETIQSVSLQTPIEALFSRKEHPTRTRKRFRMPDVYVGGGFLDVILGGQAGTYKVFVKPLGSIPLTSEREPNYPVPRRVVMGQDYKGVLETADHDTFSFFLEKPVTVRVTLDTPPGARYHGNVSTFGFDRAGASNRFEFGSDVGEVIIDLPAGEHALNLRPKQGSPAEYTLNIDYLTPFKNPPDTRIVSVDLVPTVRAYSRFAQTVPLTVKWENTRTANTSFDIWSPYSGIILDENGSVEAPTLMIKPDMPTGKKTVWLISKSGRNVTGYNKVTINSAAKNPLQNPYTFAENPENMKGGINVGLTALGAEWVPQPDYPLDSETGALVGPNPANAGNLKALNDGLRPSESTNFGKGSYTTSLSNNSDQILSPILDLAGDNPVPLSGIVLTNRATGLNNFSEFVLETSMDGTRWVPVLNGILTEWGQRQYFPLSGDNIEARFIRLKPVMANKGPYMLTELEVIAVPGLSGLSAINLAQADLGAMGRSDSTWIYARDFLLGLGPRDAKAGYFNMSDEAWTDTGLILTFKNQSVVDIETIAFHYGQDAQNQSTVPAKFARVMGSMTGPAGPFREVAILELPDDFGPGSVFKAQLPERARLNTLKIEYAPKDNTSQYVDVPVRYDVFEGAESEDYRSALGFGPEFSARPIGDGRVTQEGIVYNGDETAIDRPKQAYLGAVEFSKTKNVWTVPSVEGQNTVRLSVIGERGFYPKIESQNDSGALLEPLEIIDFEASGRRDYVFSLAAGQLSVVVSEPPRSTVFLVDQSSSMTTFISQIRRSIIDYSDMMVPQQDRVQFQALGREWFSQDWVDDPQIVRRLLLDYHLNGNSNAETGLAAAADKLDEIDGLRSIVIVTDADAGPSDGLVKKLKDTQSRIFVVKVSSASMWGNPRMSSALATQWSEVSGGDVFYVSRADDISKAYERISTRLLGEKTYQISAAYETRIINPGQLVTKRQERAEGEERADREAIHVLFDASGSMLKRTPNGRRIQIAKASVSDFIQGTTTETMKVGLRTFGGAPDTCETALQLRPEDGSSAAFLMALDTLRPQNNAKTPIAAALAELTDDLSGLDGQVRVLLITDGEETCDGDAETVIRALVASDLAERVDIVSFALDSEIDRSIYKRWADAGRGVYIDANDGDTLTQGLMATQDRRFEVWKAAERVASGIVGQAPIALDPGQYEFRSGDFTKRLEIKADKTVTVSVSD